MRVVSLSHLADGPEICIRDTRSGRMTLYAPGDKLAGGQIVTVDYRQMPRADKPEILSGSRAIVKIGATWWAVELGQTVAQRYRLRKEQLPVELRPASSTAPAEENTSQPAARRVDS